jgi:YebC/PmpR family DNA-binding regulatory protein
MSGHNKWSKIKHKKAKEDSKRGKAFTRLIKEITVVARQGGGSVDGNARLRTLVEKAREINMPQDNIVRAIKKGTGELPGVNYEASTYEGYGPGGIAILVETLSDNKNRTVADTRHIFSKHGGNLGETGSVNWMFKHMGVIEATGDISEDALIEALLDFNIIDIKKDENHFSIITDTKSVDTVKQAVKNTGLQVESAESEWVAQNPVEVTEDQANKAVALLSALEDHDDVQNVYTNMA